MNHWKKELEHYKQSLIDWEKKLFLLPELGFKEVKTTQAIQSFLKQENIKVTQDFGINGFAVTLGEGTPHVGLIAELDALPVPSHPDASEEGAAHACGHHLQTDIMMHVLAILNKNKDRLKGSVTCYFIAAEEFIDLDYRLDLQANNKITLLSGKQNLILQDAFNDVDVLISCHTMGEVQGPSMELNATLSGFIYKKLTFYGISSHAAVAPEQGVNALNALVLTQNAIALLRETFTEDNRIRVHMMTTLGGQSVNAIPEKAILEGYVRAGNSKALLETSEAIDHAATHIAKGLKATCEVSNTMGYMPFNQSKALSSVLEPFITQLIPKENLVNHQHAFAAGDVGDCSMFTPTIQFGFSGCVGRVHGKDFRMDNPEEALFNPVLVTLASVEKLLNDAITLQQVKDSFTPTMTLKEYKHLHHVD